jgi:DNA segregation ATPase FtsK/SpoIIIE, S-DNA-T family
MGSKRETRSKVPRKRLMKEEDQVVEKSRSGLMREGLALLLSGYAIFLGTALFSYIGSSSYQQSVPSSNMMGRLGFSSAHFLFEYLGYCSIAAVLCLFLAARFVWVSQEETETEAVTFSRVLSTVFFAAVLILSSATIASSMLNYDGGGYLGSSIAVYLDSVINKGGTVLFAVLAIVLSLSVIVDLRLSHYALLVSVLFKGFKIAAKDTGTVLKASAKAGGACIKKIPEMVVNDDIDDFGEPESYETLSETRKKRKIKRVKKKRNWEIGEEPVPEEDEFQLDDASGKVPFEPTESSVQPRILRDLKSEKKRSPHISHTRGNKKKSKSGKSDSVLSGGSQSLRHRGYEDYELPSQDLLVGVDIAASSGPDDDELLQNSKKLEQSLRNFKIGGKVVEVHPGPVVTLYQFEPAAGIKVQRIINLADDLALALKVESVRVYAPVPGKGTVGIEVPNAEREIVRLRDLVDSDEFQLKPHPLSLALGKDTYGKSFISDLSKMPHLLIAGATGTGKSVCINSLLMSLLYKNTPDDLRLILIDPKMLELSVYEKIPHLLSPVITNPKRARGVLYWAVEEMERRYSLMKDLGVRDLSMYNRSVSEGRGSEIKKRAARKESLITLEEKDVISTTAAEALARDAASGSSALEKSASGFEPMPRIVIVVDELADLMLTVGREIEELLPRLAQKARAAGIHLILATQRPSVNVITGLIKANFPARISFKVTSKIDARTIMDQSGAERLLGQGDMLFYSPAIGRVKRLHSPFVSDQEVHDVVSWIQSQGSPDYNPEIERVLEVMEENDGTKSSFDGEGDDAYDPLYDQAVNLVLEKGQASTSMVQRVFRIGYNRAARILETMEKEGVVGPADGAKPRQVLSAPVQ